MRPPQKLLIFGASTRAAAFSALRAGLEPWCADLFADADLQARCPVTRILVCEYPDVFAEVAARAPPGPWMYTGGLENRSRLVDRISARHRLWGIGENLGAVRDAALIAWELGGGQIPCPRVQLRPPANAREPRWLAKPRMGAGGAGIRFYDDSMACPGPSSRLYFQEFIEGDSRAAIYLGEESRCWLLGVTEQLVGADWLHAAPFHYCGSIGPLALEAPLRPALETLGNALVAIFGLRGLFGVDCVVRDGLPYPVEINPRYTASVEVWEHVTGIPALALHRSVFAPGAPAPSLAPKLPPGGVIGKAILFARAPLNFPADGPWMETLRQPGDIWQLPEFADIPDSGTPIQVGQPILTFFARADSPEDCRAKLQERAAQLDRILFGCWAWDGKPRAFGCHP